MTIKDFTCPPYDKIYIGAWWCLPPSASGGANTRLLYGGWCLADQLSIFVLPEV